MAKIGRATTASFAEAGGRRPRDIVQTQRRGPYVFEKTTAFSIANTATLKMRIASLSASRRPRTNPYLPRPCQSELAPR
jgi:hypothetical protein